MDDILRSPAQPSTSRDVPLRVRQGVKALVTSTDGVLLVRERHVDGSAFWTLPGGGLQPGESRPDGMRRELAEELCCRSTVGEELTSFRYRHRSHRNAVTDYSVYRCSLLSDPTPVETEGIEACRWVAPAELPVETLPEVRDVLRGGAIRETTTAGPLQQR